MSRISTGLTDIPQGEVFSPISLFSRSAASLRSDDSAPNSGSVV